MSEHVVAIAPIPLARSIGRILASPALLLIAGVVSVGGGANVGGLVGIGLVAAGLVVAALSMYLAAMLLTVRLDVEVATLRLRWLGGERRYTLVRGPVTRVALAGDEAARLRPRFGALGWAVGRARLRRDEEIDIVRLAPTGSMILVPTDRGRLGIAPASEEQLLSALGAAARIQQRLDEVAERARAFMDLAPVREVPAAGPEPAVAPDGRRVLTGIERQLLEERMASERAGALERAEAERLAAVRAAEAAAAIGAAVEVAPAAPPTTIPPERQQLRRRLSAWIAARRADRPAAGEVAPPAATLDAAVAVPAAEPIPVPQPIAPPEPIAVAEPIVIAEAVEVAEPPVASAVPAAPGRSTARDDQLLAFGLALTPVIGAGLIWLIAYLRGDLSLSVEELRPIALALLAVGPAGALAALAARAWFPRLQGLVTITALTALVLVGRVLLG
jgi:hypothetical protein